ncbi:amidase [Lujinxingia litoralis]|uniref:Amidase n=1 Tax=Lujinxingia litoralis TaxID=2211119 RepID=A0A328CC21_9DELT|nr:amidase [Lujinxingia litoralis]RAL23077.1 amidase [Lujinxingia litoralis]
MRLTGPALTIARKAAESPAGALILRKRAMADFGIDRLLELPASSRGTLRFDPQPLQSRRKRGWNDQKLDPPSTTPGRTTMAALARAYRSGESSPVEVLERIQQQLATRTLGESTHSPFVCTDFERALDAAAASHKRLQAGNALGPLDGIPIPIKDQVDMQGMPVRCGTSYFNPRSESDGHVIAHLRNAGALLYGRTHTTEWGMNPSGFSPHFAMPRNVYSRHHGAGGSSTGSAVAVALGLAPVALGSDGGGSIRIPSALNGLLGIKPTFGRIGRTGDVFGAGTVSTMGPLGQSTADLVEFLIAASAPDPLDPASRWAPRQPRKAEQWRKALGRGVRGARIGYLSSELDALDPALQQPTLDALRQFAAEGATLVELDLELVTHALAIGVLTIGLETLGNLTDHLREFPADFSEEVRVLIASLRTITTEEFMAAQRTRELLKEQLREALDDVDLIAMPTTRTTALPYDLNLTGAQLLDDQGTRDMCRFTFLANITGLPAGSIPIGRHNGLPFGLQFIGAAFDEASVLAAMAHGERLGLHHLPAPADYLALA